MPRIIGVDIPANKALVISLTYLFGVGPALSKQIIEKLGFDPKMRARDLSESDISKLNGLLQTDYLVEGSLRREIRKNIDRLKLIKSYRGMRHRIGLPVRGQKTGTNARTRKGRRRAIPGKKKATAPK